MNKPRYHDDDGLFGLYCLLLALFFIGAGYAAGRMHASLIRADAERASINHAK